MASLTALVGLLALTAGPTQAAFQQTPTLGYNTYNAVACSPNETYVQQTIDALSSQGFVSAGYNIFQVDCGWQSRYGQRNADGSLKINSEAFPSGIMVLSEYAARKGMKWGMYSDAGVRACDTTVPSPILGSLGHEDADAKQFASWNTYTVKASLPGADTARARTLS